ncbi:MIP/aquaporin family protein [Bailinhaonella thermotolerans]|uniref:Aquaporin family protein n=1 Tax=Bailinhaonella thermotolerans TaxID=1070861 RepID=A0A3A4AVS0_9ACTN|nr:MIP/aquaporin family protein [Bailinhaonella thermotolerans]RJL29973.1 aquaporin family protein [Bailinhaonella thermotolerans]
MSGSSVFIGEFVGTGLLLLLGVGVCAAVTLPGSKARGAGWVAITLGWGMGVLAGAYAVLPLSGAHLNPAVTLGISVSTGEWSRFPLYVGAQLLGAFTGAVLAFIVYFGQFRAYRGPTLAIFATVPEIRRPAQNLATETIATFTLVFVVLATGRSEALALSGTGVLMVALLVVGIGLSLGGPTGYAINPARDLGARLAHAVLPLPSRSPSDWPYAWIPIAGPSLGGLLAGYTDTLLH